jgi:hypothetical protein
MVVSASYHTAKMVFLIARSLQIYCVLYQISLPHLTSLPSPERLDAPEALKAYYSNLSPVLVKVYY